MDFEKKRIKAHDIGKMIDHSLLKPQLTKEDVVEGCKLAKKYNTATVCVRPCDVNIAREILQGTDVLVTTVIGFPHGSNLTKVKVLEAEEAIKGGCKELDLVLNIGMLISKDYDYVENDIKEVVEIAHKNNVIVKVIFENCYLNDELKEKACQICEKVGVDFVKTSTGFGTGGATVKDLKLMRKICSEKIKVKAAGGVRTLDAAITVKSIGVVRFGATATEPIMEEAIKREKENILFEEYVENSMEEGY